MKLNLNPVRSKVSNGVNPVIRFLYTGREYNVETGNYYYRMRMMDSSVGRFSSKDPIVYLNLYRYARNYPLYFIDCFGNAYFAKISFFGGRYDLSNEGSAADLRNLQLVHEGILWDDRRLTGFKLGGYDEDFVDNWWLGNLTDSQNYTLIGDYYDDDLLQQAVGIVEDIRGALGIRYNLFNFNCQHWSDFVRTVYDILADD